MNLLFLISLRFNFELPKIGPEKIFRQKLDHFDNSNHNYFDQIYYENFDYFDSSNPRMVFYIGGEATLTFGSNATIKKGPIEEICNRTKSYFAALEHRFYGKSAPDLDLKTSVLKKYLNSQQAMEDLATFIQSKKDEVCGIHTNCPVLVIGGSYAGTLSSLFRMKYPHVANFSWASSPPLNIKNDFPEYDRHVGNAIKSYSQDCFNRSVYFMRLLENNQSSYDYFRSHTNFKQSTDPVSLHSAVADLFAGIVQYDTITDAIKDYCDRDIGYSLEKFTDFFNEQTPDPDSGDSLLLFNESYYQPTDYKNSRAWTWQTCNEFGWFQTASGEFRSSLVNLSYYEKVCKECFGVDIPNTEDINLRYGLLSPKSTNVIFANGNTDPWSNISLPPNYHDSSLQQYNFHIDGGSHCSELSLNPNESADLIYKRKQMYSIIEDWFNFDFDKCSTNGTPYLAKCICKYSYSGLNCDKRSVKELTFKIFSGLVVFLPTFMMIIIGIAAWCLFRKDQQEPDTKTIIS